MASEERQHLVAIITENDIPLGKAKFFRHDEGYFKAEHLCKLTDLMVPLDFYQPERDMMGVVCLGCKLKLIIPKKMSGELDFERAYKITPVAVEWLKL